MKCLNCFICGLVMMASSSAQIDYAPRRPKVTFWVYNYAHADGPTLQGAARWITALFSQMGVDTAWLDCFSGRGAMHQDECRGQTADSTEIAVRILSEEMSRKLVVTGQPLGFAMPYSRNDRVNIVNVFYDEVERVAEGAPAASGEILGGVAAHEVGHLLLGHAAHSVSGLMCGEWRSNELALLAAGHLTLLQTQANSIRRELLLREKAAR